LYAPPNEIRLSNTADYAVPTPARLGTCGRNTLFGPDLVQFDFNVTRSFHYFGEGRRLELRWDMLNCEYQSPSPPRSPSG
jgi:hypothetical protein